jgi:hypothetical protein
MIKRWIIPGFLFGVGFWAAALLLIYATGFAEILLQVIFGL